MMTLKSIILNLISCLPSVKFCINNPLLTEREGRTGEYFPEGQYSPVRPVSNLLYGTVFLIVKCTSGGLHSKNVRLLHPSLKFWKNFNLLASAGSFNVKNENFQTFFRCLGCKC